MKSQQFNVLNIISKLMNEEIEITTELRNLYDKLFSIIEENLATSLDKGMYNDNARVIRQINAILMEKEIFVLIPELAEKSIISIWGNSECISEIFQNIRGNSNHLAIELNTNLPLIIIPTEKIEEDKIFCITYMDKIVSISSEEYKFITRELYKLNIDIHKLVKGFLFYSNNFKYLNQIYIIFPEYIDKNNELLKKISKIISKQILILDNEEKWNKLISKLLNQETLILGRKEINDEDLIKIKKVSDLRGEKEFRDICEINNIPSINYTIKTEFEEIFFDIIKFYYEKRKILNNKITKLTEESLKLSDTSIKENIQEYRKKLLEQKDNLEKSYNSFIKIYNEIINASLEFEKSISTTLLHDLPNNINSERYISTLIKVFFKQVYANEFDKAKETISYLKKANYSYLNFLTYLLKNKQGYPLEAIDIIKLKEFPNSLNEIVKIKIELSNELNLSPDELKEAVSNISQLETGKENYYYGIKLLDEKKFIEASNYFFTALDNNFDMAGIELIKLANEHPECKINLEELAENLVVEANYYIGKNSFPNKYKKGVVNLKIAASKGHIGAIEMIADILFNECKKIPFQNMIIEDNENSVYNVIRLYTYLDKIEEKEDYKLKIGLMYCKIMDYSRAYLLLKEINKPEAQYECAKMYQYGKGVARNLKEAKKFYEKINPNYKDVSRQYEKICRYIKNDELKKERESYNENSDYTSTSSTISSSSSFCFITTAACLALNKDKDCNELNELRKFRDSHILGNGEDGNDLVEEYYRIGPTIVNYIDREWNPFAIYTELWQDYILPSYDMIKENKNEDAKLIYIEMVKSLCEKYNVPVKKNIMKKYSIKIK